MFVYLSKKIAIPHGIKLQTISWNTEQGWIACGGGNGLLKVLKLENKGPVRGKKKKAAPINSNLSMNQTLEGHNGTVFCVTWNENYRKLTTSDQYGLIIVWMLHKGMWFEEMINNRNKSVVRDMKWTADGQKICIVYEDGAVIVGSVDGNRLWGKELETELSLVEWSPDGRNILFGTLQGQVHLYDNLGNFISRLNIYANTADEGAHIIGIVWYSGAAASGAPYISGTGFGVYADGVMPSLAIVFDNGRVQIMRDDTDDNPILIDTGMVIAKASWNSTGNIIAIAGTKPADSSQRGQADTPMIQFYTPMGKHLRTLKVPGNSISSLSWEGGSLRLALAVDSFIYFANVRPDYEWGYFSNTLVYSFSKPDRIENCVTFWDINSDERHIKYVKQLIAIRASGENCVFATRTDDGSGQFILILCNAIGSPVDSKYIDVEPIYLAMTPFHVIVSDGNVVYTWQYRTQMSRLTSLATTSGPGSGTAAGGGGGGGVGGGVGGAGAGSKLKRKEVGRERIFHLDDPSNCINASSSPRANTGLPQPTISRQMTEDPLSALTASKTSLIIARASGTLMRFALPHLALESTHFIPCRAHMLALNCTGSRLSIIDFNGVLTLFDFDAVSRTAQQGEVRGAMLDFERKDAWDMLWSDDNPDLLACMEKTRMYVFRGLNAEEPVLSSAFLCSFSDLCIQAVMLDDIMTDPEHPDKEWIVNFDTKSLRDTRELLASVPIQEAVTFIEEHPHPRLWRLLAETALEQLQFNVADKAFVRCRDYQGIQFVKRLKLLGDRNKQKAEVAAYFRRFDEAENILLGMDCKDMAVELRVRLGDWFRVVQLLTQNSNGEDAMQINAYKNIGDYYADRQKWIKAYKFYSKSRSLEQMVHCAYLLDDFTALEELIDQIAPGSALLKNVGAKFQSVGMCEQAVSAFLKADDPKAAIDCCVLLNQWDQAVSLAELHRVPNIETLLTKYATHLLQKNKLFQAVELYRKARRHAESARLLGQLAVQVTKSRVQPVRAKKLWVMAALEVERHRAQVVETSNHRMSAADSLMGVGGGGAGGGNDGSGKSPTGRGSQTGAPGNGKSVISGATAALESLMSLDGRSSSSSSTSAAFNPILEQGWQGAEALHWFLLAQRQLYAGQVEQAMKTALRLVDYENVLESKDIYSLIAFASFSHGYFAQCSQALIKLEGMSGLTRDEQRAFRALALSIFTSNRPIDPTRRLSCPSCAASLDDWSSGCSECNTYWGTCIASGKTLAGIPDHDVRQCATCKHRGLEKEMRRYQNCPLCHSAFSGGGAGGSRQQGGGHHQHQLSQM